MSFDKYLSECLGFTITHGITEAAAKQLLQEWSIEVKETDHA